MEYMKDVLIKEAAGLDLVFVVDNLPKELLFMKAKKLVFVPRYATDYDVQFPKQVEAYVLRDEDAPDEPRNRRVTGEMVDELLPGIERSQTGDGGYVFHTAELIEAKQRLDAIDRYIQQALPPLSPIPKREPYSSVRGSFSAPPRPVSQLPRVVLPEPVSPPASAVQAPQATPVPRASFPEAPELPPTKKRQYTEEQLQKMRDRLARVREMKKHKPPLGV